MPTLLHHLTRRVALCLGLLAVAAPALAQAPNPPSIRIVEQGPRDALVAANGLYARLARGGAGSFDTGHAT